MEGLSIKPLGQGNFARRGNNNNNLNEEVWEVDTSAPGWEVESGNAYNKNKATSNFAMGLFNNPNASTPENVRPNKMKKDRRASRRATRRDRRTRRARRSNSAALIYGGRRVMSNIAKAALAEKAALAGETSIAGLSKSTLTAVAPPIFKPSYPSNKKYTPSFKTGLTQYQDSVTAPESAALLSKAFGMKRKNRKSRKNRKASRKNRKASRKGSRK